MDSNGERLTFGSRVLDFNNWLKSVRLKLPEGIETLVPFRSAEVRRVNEAFYSTFYDDRLPRTVLLGINPGRLGAGLTGIPFTDPVQLGKACGIGNDLLQKAELSSDFIYRMIGSLGGPHEFYRHFYITSVCPLGFVSDGVNMNYYDDPELLQAVEPFIIRSVKRQLQFDCRTDVAFIIGEGKNLDYFEQLNEKYRFFDKLIGLPHPRFIMQYKRKQLYSYLKLFSERLSPYMNSGN